MTAGDGLLQEATTGALLNAIRAEIKELTEEITATHERGQAAKENVLRFAMREQMLRERLSGDETAVIRALSHDFSE